MKYLIEVDNSQLISAIDFIKKMVSKDGTRPMLTAINFRVSGIYLTLTACDGFRLAEEKILILNNPDNEDIFEFSIDISKVKLPKHDGFVTIIEFDKEKDIVFFDTLGNGVSFRVLQGEYMNTASIIESAEEKHNFKIAFNPKYIAEACQAFKGEKTVYFNINTESILSPITVTAKDSTKKQLLLPVRQ